MEKQELLQIDANHIWHPYSSASMPMTPYIVKKAEGVFLYLEDGIQVIDGMSSWWSVIHGYNNPKLNKALQEQAAKMSHVMFGGLTHQPAVELCSELLKIVPQNLTRVFYSDSGSVAVEVAMKMAIQYQYSLGFSKKQKFISLRGGYHGDTWHAMSVCDPVGGMHHLFAESLPQQIFAPRPPAFTEEYSTNYKAELRVILEEHKAELAAFILEPIVQGAGGMFFYNPQYLADIAELCEEFNILLIADEIATGFGRTGKMFACEYAQVQPDILCMGKGLTGGYMSFAATLCTEQIAATISNAQPGVFMHGPTFMGNPLACSLALASLKILAENNWQNQVAQIQTELQNHLSKLQNHNAVADVRIMGAIGVVEMKEDIEMKKMQEACIAHGIWLRPFGKLLYTMPPFSISKVELTTLASAIVSVIKDVYDQ